MTEPTAEYTHVVRYKNMAGEITWDKFTSFELALAHQKKLQATGAYRQVIVMPVPKEPSEVRA